MHLLIFQNLVLFLQKIGTMYFNFCPVLSWPKLSPKLEIGIFPQKCNIICTSVAKLHLAICGLNGLVEVGMVQKLSYYMALNLIKIFQ
jgi:hypothetical protein